MTINNTVNSTNEPPAPAAPAGLQPPAPPPSLASPPAPPPLPKRRHRSQGKVARLPLEIRNLVNQALRDGRRYPEIIALLLAQGFSGFTPHNISSWARGDYRHWLAAQERFESTCPLSEKAQAILGQLHPNGRSALADVNESLLVVYFHQLLESFDSPDLPAKSDAFLRVAKALATCMTARAHRQRAELERLNYELELRKIEREESRPKSKGLSPETIRQIEAAAKML